MQVGGLISTSNALETGVKQVTVDTSHTLLWTMPHSAVNNVTHYVTTDEIIRAPTFYGLYQCTAHMTIFEGRQWWGGRHNQKEIKDWSLDCTTIYFPYSSPIPVHWWCSLHMAVQRVPAHSDPPQVQSQHKWYDYPAVIWRGRSRSKIVLSIPSLLSYRILHWREWISPYHIEWPENNYSR